MTAQCDYCGVAFDERDLEVEHIHPRFHGGMDGDGNYARACRRCNRLKGARLGLSTRDGRAGACAWPKKERQFEQVSVRLDVDLVRKLRAAVYHTPGETITSLLIRAVDGELSRLGF